MAGDSNGDNDDVSDRLAGDSSSPLPSSERVEELASAGAAFFRRVLQARAASHRLMKKLLPAFLLLLAGLAHSLRADTTVVINEIMYHPATNEPALEWVEFRNQNSVAVDISGWTVTNAIQFAFPPGTIVRGGDFLVLAIAPATLMAATGLTNVYGPFTGQLPNGGATIELRNINGRLMDSVSYGVEGDWPVGPDGSGVSLAKFDRNSASGPPANWASSEQMGGTPGMDNFPLLGVVFSESKLARIDQPWKFDASGSDLGAVWREAGFDDSAWAAGPALFYNGTVIAGEVRPIPTLFNTGVGTNGSALPVSARDPHYLLTVSAQNPTNPPVAAIVMVNNAGWLANDTASSWIGAVSSGNVNINPGNYFFQTKFSLAGFDSSSAQVNLNVAVDNDLTNVFLNGAATGVAFSGFNGFSSTFTLTNGFVDGTNTLEFQTVNQPGPGTNPGGFRALVNGTALAILTNTFLRPGPTTYYFRTSFSFTGDVATTVLRLHPQVADGAVFYLNGTEVLRLNMPDGPIDASTLAVTDVEGVDYSGPFAIPSDNLLPGTNVLAVEVHQAGAGADGMVFGAELLAMPFAPPPVTLAFNELAAATNAIFWLELFNYGTNQIDLSGFVLAQFGVTNSEYIFPTGQSLAAGNYLALSEAELGFHPQAGDKLLILPPTQNKVIDGVVVKTTLRGRLPAGVGPWLYPDQPTPGGPNSFALHNEIVINEIMYHHRLVPATPTAPAQPSTESWLELYNRSGNTVDLTGWQLSSGISYKFAAGKTIAPGGYLVVAKDSAGLRALYPAIDIVGDFKKKLGGGSDSIVLLDPNNNPANQVRYFTGGHWPEFSGGGGSSLELRDSYADNSKAEAWAASDESGKSGWNTYTYRGMANFPVNNMQPTQWNEFDLGMLAAGECLVDDISVVESPATVPMQLLQNGSFENGAASWRFLGTHGLSEVIVDPDKPGNHVLHVVATKPMEHMHNHIETTFIGNRAVVNARTYEISFRAKWLAGDNQLNTRLYFNRLGRTTLLPVPALNGTPGAQNSRYAGNIGPTFSGFHHARVVPKPGEAVTVTVVAEDPQGVSMCEVWWSANGGAWNSAPMALTPQPTVPNLYTGTIPGFPAATIVQFYVRAVDGLGAAATFPAAGPDSRALYKVDDGQANLSIAHNFRIIMTPADTAWLHAPTNVMSNRLIGNTVVFDEQQAYYDIGLRLKGSERGRDQPLRVSFHVEFHPDELFRGVHPVMLVDRSGGWKSGVSAAQSFGQDEILIKHMMNHAGGIPETQDDLCHVITPQIAQTSSAILLPRFEDDWLDTAIVNGGSGNLFKYDLIYYPISTFSGGPEGYKLPEPDNVLPTDFSDLGPDKEFYRWNFLIRNNRDLDDYSGLIAFLRTLSQTSPALLDAQTKQVMDVNQWLRTYAMISLCGVGDTYTWGNDHNLFCYVRPSDQKVMTFPWDMDFAFVQSPSGALVGDQNWSRVINLPGNLRCYYAHMLDMMNTTFNTNYMAFWVKHYNAFCDHQDFSSILTFIGQRAASVRSQLASATNAPFNLSGTNSFSTNNNLVTLTGTAPVQVKTILVNGVAYPITWNSVTSWTLHLPVSSPTNVFNLQGYDLFGNLLTNASKTATVYYTGPPPSPRNLIVINEIMYNPSVLGASYVELFNSSSSFSFDLSGWRFDGLNYTFPPGAIMTNGQFLVLVKDHVAYLSAYGPGAPLFGEFSGNLQTNGETLTLIKPGARPADDLIVNKVRYGTVPPWPADANGSGLSIQLIDASQDNSRASNWSDRWNDWRRVSASANAGSSRLFLYLDVVGDVYIDDVYLAAGSQPEVGPNLVVNGDFESDLSGPWNVSTNNAGSTISRSVSHSGSGSLHLVSTALGGSATYRSIWQDTLPVVTNTQYTLSLWYLPTTNANVLTARTSPGTLAATKSVRPIFFTPGAPNSVAATLPPYPPLWINEVQPDNLNGILDNAGEQDPWLELYNAGASALPLDGLYLANNYTNLAQWAFPAGTVINPGEFKVVFADAQPEESTAAELHANFRLAGDSGVLALSRTYLGQPQLVDYLNYANVTAGRSFGSFPDGQSFDRQEFFYVTPGGTNNGALAPLNVRINEWMASNTHTLANTKHNNAYDDWFELYNPGIGYEDLAGYYLTDNLANQFQFRVPPGYVVPPHGFLLVWADNAPGLNSPNSADLHVNFQLAKSGEQIGLFAADGTQIDAVTFGAQTNDISQGRYPDGTGAVYFLATPTPRAPNSFNGNLPPVVDPIADKIIYPGETLAFTITASDPNLPPQILTFSVDSGLLSGMRIDPASGRFDWTTLPAQPPGTNMVTVRVTDNGTPNLSAARSFKIIVALPPRVTGISRLPNGGVALSFQAIAGKTYRVEYKNALDDPDWTALPSDATATSSALTITDNIGANPQRFYRVLVVD